MPPRTTKAHQRRADQATIADLVKEVRIDLTGISLVYIEAVRPKYFCHWEIFLSELPKHVQQYLIGGPQVRFPPVFFGIEKTNGLKFQVTRCFDSRESKSLFTSPPSQWCSTLPPRLHARSLSVCSAWESIKRPTLGCAAVGRVGWIDMFKFVYYEFASYNLYGI